MRGINDYAAAKVELDFILRQISIQTHMTIRVFGKNKKLIKKYGRIEDDNDPVMCDEEFFEKLFAYGWKDCPHLYYEFNRVVYAVIQIKYGGVMILGPVSLDPVRQELSKKVIQEHHLKEDGGFRLSHCVSQTFVSGLLIVLHMLTGKKVNVDTIWEKNFINEDMRYKIEQTLVETRLKRQEQELPHTPYTLEKLAQQCLTNGDKEGLKNALVDTKMSEYGILSLSSLRQAKNMAISVITLASRAAIEGGVIAETAFTVNDSYIQMVESMTTPEQVDAVVMEAQYKLVDMVKEAKVKEELPHPLIHKVKDYVFKNLQNEMKVSDMAEEFAVNADYLSYLFHKSTGKTITQYILEEKVKAAQSMLIYTENTLQEIAFALNFSSQSHFSTVFRKFTGMSPREFRDTYTIQRTGRIGEESEK